MRTQRLQSPPIPDELLAYNKALQKFRVRTTVEEHALLDVGVEIRHTKRPGHPQTHHFSVRIKAGHCPISQGLVVPIVGNVARTSFLESLVSNGDALVGGFRLPEDTREARIIVVRFIEDIPEVMQQLATPP